MCNFKSALVVRDESIKDGVRVLFSPWTESHSELCLIFGQPETDKQLNVAKVEFSPPSTDKADKVETYVLKLDQERAPDWWTDEIKAVVAARLTAYVKSIIITGDVALLIGGQFILAGKAKIEAAKNCLIYAMLASSQVGEMLESSKVGEMRASSKVGKMWASSQVGEMLESSKVGTMLESSQVGTMWASSQVGTMRASSKVVTDNRIKK